MNDRIESLRQMLEKRPDDPRIRFGLAAEFEKQERWEEMAAELKQYLAVTDDEGNAWGRMGHALRRMGHDAEAREAYRQGIEAAKRHGHPSMAAEFEQMLEAWEE